jgi:hypothetical protein
MKSIAHHAPAAARVVFGLVFLIFGLNGFLQFLPSPSPPEGAAKFFGAIIATGYMFPLIKGIEIVVGALLLSNRFVPLALALIAPNVVNIVLFHIFLAPSELGLAGIVLALELYLAWAYRDAYAPMLRARVRPRSTRGEEPISAHAHA